MNWVHKIKSIPVWKKYSQANEESYLEFILKNIEVDDSGTKSSYYNPVKPKMLLELGAWDGYHLSNTRYFIEKGYQALLIDGDNKGNKEVEEHFITKENVISLLQQYRMPKEFDLFCIDLDGNDLYVMEEVLKGGYKPSVIIAEFNPIFEKDESYTITYNPEHTWSEDDYYGFSFAAGIKMTEKYGYTCIFQNDNLNMYFVENTVLAKSLGIDVDDFGWEWMSEVHDVIPKVQYQKTNYHPKSQKTGWVAY